MDCGEPLAQSTFHSSAPTWEKYVMLVTQKWATCVHLRFRVHPLLLLARLFFYHVSANPFKVLLARGSRPCHLVNKPPNTAILAHNLILDIYHVNIV